MKARSLTLEELSVGTEASFERMIVQSDIEQFAKVSGDYNPLHLDPEYAASTPFGRPIAHGMLLGALCSALVGMYLPGQRCLYLSQSLKFKKPVFANDTVVVSGTITSISAATRVVSIAITIRTAEEEVAAGEAQVQVLPYDI